MDNTGKTILHYCVENKSTKVATFVLEKEPSLLEKKDNEGYTPLQLAVIANNTSMVNFLLKKGADIKSTDNEGHTVVHWATG